MVQARSPQNHLGGMQQETVLGLSFGSFLNLVLRIVVAQGLQTHSVTLSALILLVSHRFRPTIEIEQEVVVVEQVEAVRVARHSV